jgi:hypothetical protein
MKSEKSNQRPILNPARSKPLSLYPLKFEEVISDVLKVKPQPKRKPKPKSKRKAE